VTLKRRTHFEQVSMEVIRKIIDENALKEKIITSEEARGTEKQYAEADLLETTAANGWSERG
jgi:hypothetical protein